MNNTFNSKFRSKITERKPTPIFGPTVEQKMLGTGQYVLLNADTEKNFNKLLFEKVLY